MREEGRPPLKPLIKVHETTRSGEVYRDARVRVTCATVDHYTVKPAFAFRFDTPKRSIVVSGDTTYSNDLIDLARGADLLVHEAMYLPGVDRLAAGNLSLKEHLLRSHSTTEQVGLVAARPGCESWFSRISFPHSPPSQTTCGSPAFARTSRAKRFRTGSSGGLR